MSRARRIAGRDKLLKKMAALPKVVREELKKAVDESANEISDLQRRLAPEQSGALKRSIKVHKGNYRPDNSNVRGLMSSGQGSDPDLTAHLVAGDAVAWYAALVEFGTDPHRIAPRDPSGSIVLGGRRFRYVDHPGAKPRPFFFSAYRSMRRRARARMARAAKLAAQKVAKG